MLILSHLSLMSHIAPPVDTSADPLGGPIPATSPPFHPRQPPAYDPTPLPRLGACPIRHARPAPCLLTLCASPPPVPLGLTPAPDTRTAPLKGRLVSGAAGAVAGGVAGVSPPPPPPETASPAGALVLHA
jgi:hypothetical protein